MVHRVLKMDEAEHVVRARGMVVNDSAASRTRRRGSGFTLAEVVVAIFVLTILVGGVIYGYIGSAQRAEWSAHSLAAQSLASQGLEQARAAKWDPQAWPVVDELPPTNYSTIEKLDIVLSGIAYYATNFVKIQQFSTDPPLRRLQVDCVWKFYKRGLFTNTVISLRAPD